MRVRFNKGGWICCQVNFKKSFRLWKYQLLEDEDASGRMKAVDKISSFGKKALPILQTVLEKEKLFRIREGAVQSLGKINSPLTFKLLLFSLKDPHSKVRKSALQQLGKYKKKKKQLASLLLKMLKKDPSYSVQAQICLTLCTLKIKNAFEICLKMGKKPSPRNIIRQYIAYGLQELKDPRGPSLLYSYCSYQNATGGMEYDRLTSLQVLGTTYSKSKITRQALLEFLKDPHFRMRAKAANLAGKIHLIESVFLLKKMEKDPFGSVQNSAKKALKKIEKFKKKEEKGIKNDSK